MMTVVKCFSVLVASGNGERCLKLRDIIRDQLLTIEPDSGQLKVIIHKYGKKTNPKAHLKVCKEIAYKVSPIFSDIDDKYFCHDNQKDIFLNSDDGNHILIFRRLLEKFMSQGRWAGWMADKS